MDLAPNGLPYSIGTQSENEWCKISPLLAHLPADTTATMHPCTVARQRNDVGGGMGIFAYFGIPKGEVVWAELFLLIGGAKGLHCGHLAGLQAHARQNAGQNSGPRPVQLVGSPLSSTKLSYLAARRALVVVA